MTTNSTKILPSYKDSPYGFPISKLFAVENYQSAINYKPRPDDLFIVTYPKCGTTWVQNIVTCIFKEGKPPFDSAAEFLLNSPFLEGVGAGPIQNMKRPGAIKSHLPYDLMPKSNQAKYIFVARNPKDCCVSFYFHTKNFKGYDFEEGQFDDFFDLFVEGKVDFGDYFDILLTWYEHRDDPNVLFLTYEDLKNDPENQILKIAEFMGNKYKEMFRNNKEMMGNVIKHSSVKFMKENLNRQVAEMAAMPADIIKNYPHELMEFQKLFNADPNSTNYVRKGIVGDWKNLFSKEQNERMEKRFKEKTKGTDIPQLWKEIM